MVGCSRNVTRQALLVLGFAGVGFFSAAHAADLIIKDATIFDSTGKPPYVASVRVDGDRIVEIDTVIEATEDTKVVDAKGMALMAGLIDIHTHWTPGGQPNTFPLIAKDYLENGVTTIFDFHAAPESYVPKRAWVASLLSPHTNYAARISTPAGHGAVWGDKNMTRTVSTPENGKFAVKAVNEYKPDFLKIFTDGWRYGGIQLNTSMNEDAVAAVADQANEFNLPTLTHTVTVDKGKEAARAGVTAIAHSIQDRVADRELVNLMVENGTSYAPSFAVYEPKPSKMRNRTPEQIEATMDRWNAAFYNLRMFKTAGINIAIGTDAGMPGTPHGESTIRELELLVAAGLTPSEALIAGTVGGAKATWKSDDRGTIEVGKRADFILLEGMPWNNISDIRNSKTVFVDGKALVENGSLIREQPDVMLAAIKISNVIDDFENENGRTNLDTLRLDERDNGTARSSSISLVTARPDGGHSLFVSAQMVPRKNANASVVFPFSRGSITPVDISEYDGVRFDVRGGGEYLLSMMGMKGQWAKRFNATGAWQTIEISFSDLEIMRGELDWTGKDMRDLKIGGHRDGDSKFWMEVDNVRLF